MKPYTIAKQSNSGSSLMVVLVLITTMALLIGAVAMITTGEARFMKRSVDRDTAIAYADGVVEDLFDQWRNAMSTGTSLTQTQKKYGPTGNELAASPFSISISTGSTSIHVPPANMSLSSWSL